MQTLKFTSETQIHRQSALTAFNRERLTPSIGTRTRLDASTVEIDLRREMASRRLEAEFLAEELDAIQSLLRDVPTDPDAFITWFENLKKSGPGQGDPLFPWLAREASRGDMRWFIGQEVAGEAGFDDLVAMTQIRMPGPVKLELAKNYWDEMGRGNEKGMHGPMLAVLAAEMEIESGGREEIVPEALALGNLMVALAANRNFAYQSVGCLGVVELTAPDRARAVYEGLKRLGISPAGQRYYLLHSTLDVQHSISWNRDALRPLVQSNPHSALAIAEGALMRLSGGARCFARYRRELGI